MDRSSLFVHGIMLTLPFLSLLLVATVASSSRSSIRASVVIFARRCNVPSSRTALAVYRQAHFRYGQASFHCFKTNSVRCHTDGQAAVRLYKPYRSALKIQQSHRLLLDLLERRQLLFRTLSKQKIRSKTKPYSNQSPGSSM